MPFLSAGDPAGIALGKIGRALISAFLVGGACFLLLTRIAGADDAYGVPVGPPPPDIPPVTTPNTNVSSHPTANATNSNGPAQEVADVQSKMDELESKYKTETAEAVHLVKDRYLENLKQLLQSEMDKGNQEAIAAVKKKLDELATPGSPAPKPPEIATTPKLVPQPNVVTISPEVELRRLSVKFEKETRDITDPQDLSAIQSRYHDLFKQLLHKEIVKGDESGALAVKLEMVKTRPGYPFTRRWATHGADGGYSLIEFMTDGNWGEATNGNYTPGQWQADDDKNAVVNFPDNSSWHFQLNEEGHLIRNDGLDYGPDDKIRAYVPQAEDGSLTLGPDDADISGTHLQKGVGIPPALSLWTDNSDCATWQAKVRKSGTYRVVFNYSLPPECLGSVVVLSMGSDQVNFTPPSTGDWNTYQEKDAGQITLKAGALEVDLTAVDKPGPGVMNLRSITLVPVDQADQ